MQKPVLISQYKERRIVQVKKPDNSSSAKDNPIVGTETLNVNDIKQEYSIKIKNIKIE